MTLVHAEINPTPRMLRRAPATLSANHHAIVDGRKGFLANRFLRSQSDPASSTASPRRVPITLQHEFAAIQATTAVLMRDLR